MPQNQSVNIYKTGQKQPYVKIKEGFASDLNGNPYNGQVTINAEYFPSQFKDVLKAGGKSQDALDATKDLKVTFDNGRIVNVSGKYIGNVDRIQLRNYQLAWNKEPQRGDQPRYGEGKGKNNKNPKRGELD